MMDLNKLDIRKLLPPSVSTDEEMIIFSKLADYVLGNIYNMASYVQSCGDVSLLPEDVLDNLSWELNVDFYESTLPIETKRGLIENALLNQMIKGTPTAVENLLKVVFDTSEVVEWFDYGGTPSTFKIMTTDYVDLEKYQKIRDVIDVVKNVRSHLDSFVLKREKSISLSAVAYVQSAKKTIIEPI